VVNRGIERRGLGGHEGRAGRGEEIKPEMKGLLKGDRREQTSLRHARTNALSWKEITQAVAESWDTEWELAKGAHGSGALAAALYVSRHYSGPLVAGAGPIGRRDTIPRGNDGDPSI
jgi:hypothetical protein